MFFLQYKIVYPHSENYRLFFPKIFIFLSCIKRSGVWIHGNSHIFELPFFDFG